MTTAPSSPTCRGSSTLSGSYTLPCTTSRCAAKYNARAGDPLNRTDVFRSPTPTLTQPSATVRVAPRGDDRTDDRQPVPRPPSAKRFPGSAPASLEAHARPVQRDERQSRAAPERSARHHVGPADPHPDAAHHPLRRDCAVLTRERRSPPQAARQPATALCRRCSNSSHRRAAPVAARRVFACALRIPTPATVRHPPADFWVTVQGASIPDSWAIDERRLCKEPATEEDTRP